MTAKQNNVMPIGFELFEQYANSNAVALEQSQILQDADKNSEEKYSIHDIYKHKFPYFGAVKCKVNRGVEFSLFHLNDDVVAWRYFWLGEYEPKLMNLFVDHCDESTRVLDVGAYSGCYALAAAKRGATVDAFEMVPRTAERLKINLVLNRVKNKVNIHSVGISDECAIQEAFLPRPEDFIGTGNSLSEKRNVKTVASTPCRVTRADAWWAENGCPQIDMIKLDVEEHEYQAVAGMQEVIAQCRPKVIIEVVRETYDSVNSLLGKHGYQLTNLYGLNFLAEPVNQTAGA